MKSTRDEIIELRGKAPKGVYRLVAEKLGLKRIQVKNELETLKPDDKYDMVIVNEFRRMVNAITGNEVSA